MTPIRVRGRSRASQAGNDARRLQGGLCRTRVPPVGRVTTVVPDTEITTVEVTSADQERPRVVSPDGVSQVRFIDVVPKVDDVVVPVEALST